MIISTLGAVVFHAHSLNTNIMFTLKFIIVNDDFAPRLERRAVRQLRLIKVNHDHFVYICVIFSRRIVLYSVGSLEECEEKYVYELMLMFYQRYFLSEGLRYLKGKL